MPLPFMYVHKNKSPHGDKDHMGEAKKIVESIDVNKVIFNVGSYNYLEKDLIKTLKRKNI